MHFQRCAHLHGARTHHTALRQLGNDRCGALPVIWRVPRSARFNISALANGNDLE
jgi:hypothetical protein